MAACTNCGSELETPLACGACGGLFEPAAELSPFETLGLEPAFELDARELRRRLLRASRLVHPDFHGSSGADAREAAERASARLNSAHELLADPAARADWLVRTLGGPSESEQRQMPQAFLMEVLEWNETLDAAREAAPGSPERAALSGLATNLREQREDVLANLGRLLSPLPPRGAPALVQVRAQLNALRYLATTLAQVDALALEQASTHEA